MLQTIAHYRASPRWTTLRERTRRSYEEKLRQLLAWHKAKPVKLATLRLSDALAFLDTYADRPSQREHLRAMLSVLITETILMGRRETNPFARLKFRRTRAKKAVVLWTRDDVAAYQTTAQANGWPGGAIMIRTLWETAARLSDALLWRKDIHWIDAAAGSAIEYETSKVGVYGYAPISAALGAAIRATPGEHLVTDRCGQPYRPVIDDDRVTTDFRWLRRAVIKSGGRHLLLRCLRHSAATDAIDHGMTADQTRALTTHQTEAVLVSTYAKRTRKQARQVQVARGII